MAIINEGILVRLGGDNRQLLQAFSQSRIGAAAFKAGVIGALTAVTATAVRMGLEFDRSMRLTAAATGRTSAEFKNMREEIQRLAVSSGRSTAELASGMRRLAFGGFREAGDQSKVLAAALKLSAVTGEDLEKSIGAITVVLKTMGRDASQADRTAAELFGKLSDGGGTLAQVTDKMDEYTSSIVNAITQMQAFAAANTTVTEGAASDWDRLKSSMKSGFEEAASSAIRAASKIGDSIGDAFDKLMGIDFEKIQGLAALSQATSTAPGRGALMGRGVVRAGTREIPRRWNPFENEPWLTGMPFDEGQPLGPEDMPGGQTREERDAEIRRRSQQGAGGGKKVSFGIEAAATALQGFASLASGPFVSAMNAATDGASRFFLGLLADIAQLGAQRLATSLLGAFIPGFAAGGFTGGGGIARLHAGEFVMSAAAVRSVGAANLERSNRVAGSGGTMNQTFNINVTTPGGAGGTDMSARHMKYAVEAALRQSRNTGTQRFFRPAGAM